MDLRHIRTFVNVAEMGTVSKAAVHLHVAQPALSRQIASLEEELGLKLFDRVGRRLLLTSEGEQLLNDCRGLLNYARAVGEQAQVLRRGDVGVLRVSASPHLIEGIFPDFLRDYAARYPNVQVRLVDAAAGGEAFAMLERGEIHLVQTVASAITPDEQRFASHPLAPMEMLAACHPKLRLGSDGSGRDRPPRALSAASGDDGLRHAQEFRRSMPAGRLHAEQCPRMPRSARAASHGRGGARRRHHPVGFAYPPVPCARAARHGTAASR